jgi:hypothetical protein
VHVSSLRAGSGSNPPSPRTVPAAGQDAVPSPRLVIDTTSAASVDSRPAPSSTNDADTVGLDSAVRAGSRSGGSDGSEGEMNVSVAAAEAVEGEDEEDDDDTELEDWGSAQQQRRRRDVSPAHFEHPGLVAPAPLLSHPSSSSADAVPSAAARVAAVGRTLGEAAVARWWPSTTAPPPRRGEGAPTPLRARPRPRR